MNDTEQLEQLVDVLTVVMLAGGVIIVMLVQAVERLRHQVERLERWQARRDVEAGRIDEHFSA